MRVGVAGEAQLGCARGDLHLGRQHRQQARQLHEAALGGDRQRDDYDVEPGLAGELDEFAQAAETRIAGDDAVDAIVSAVIEDAHDADVAVEVDLELLDELFRDGAATVDGSAAEEAPLAGPVVHDRADGEALGDECNRARRIPEREPDAGELVSHFEKEQSRNEQRKRRGPAEENARHMTDEGG